MRSTSKSSPRSTTAPRLPAAEILAAARKYRADRGHRDVIDVGCDPGATWAGVGDVVRRLRDENFRVSIDSFNSEEVEAAAAAGAELVLSVNASNVEAARSWGCEVVVLPDELATLDGLDRTVERLTAWNVPFRIDPVLEPIGLGFAASLGRYLEVRRRYPATPLMMGVGNLTELTDVDSAGLNVLLLAFCQEIGVRSVLTTEVINWCRSCVRELDLGRRLVYHACTERVLPKHLEPDLLLLRDPRLREHGAEILWTGLAHYGPQLSSFCGARAVARPEPGGVFARNGPVRAVRADAAARRDRCRACVLSRL